MTKPTITTQDLQRRIGHRAKSAPEHRFWGLYVHLTKLDTLEAAYLEAKRNGGAPGSDGETFTAIQERGRGEFLTANRSPPGHRQRRLAVGCSSAGEPRGRGSPVEGRFAGIRHI